MWGGHLPSYRFEKCNKVVLKNQFYFKFCPNFVKKLRKPSSQYLLRIFSLASNHPIKYQFLIQWFRNILLGSQKRHIEVLQNFSLKKLIKYTFINKNKNRIKFKFVAVSFLSKIFLLLKNFSPKGYQKLPLKDLFSLNSAASHSIKSELLQSHFIVKFTIRFQ